MTFQLEEPLTVPVNYQHLLQAFIYKILPEEEARFLHEEGYQFGNRTYKGFTYSQIIGKPVYNKKTKTLTFKEEIKISFSSIAQRLIEEVANRLLLSDQIILHGVRLAIKGLIFDDHILDENQVIVRAISPITVNQTFERRNGEKITHYFSPHDHVFSHLLEENFARKYEALCGEELPLEPLIQVRPVKVTNRDKIITSYKGFWIEGWLGTYEIKGKPEYLSFILSTGLGSRNSMGHGMVITS